jgi:hypothetical protein
MKIYIIYHEDYGPCELLVKNGLVINGQYEVKTSEDGLMVSLDKNGRYWEAKYICDVPSDLINKNYNEIFKVMYERGLLNDDSRNQIKLP